ncbi:MAG TPA: hypothetical protein VG603_02025 [Chitinophagales bacterium]|nr:hypothetical protein [Chitinophagales bacterium]
MWGKGLKKATLLIAGLLLVVLASTEYYRAWHISMTHDESYSFTRYVMHPYLNIIFYVDIIILPNNHVLNTIGMKLFSWLFGIHPFVLRLTNLIAFTGLCYSAFNWAKKQAGYLLILPCLAILLLNPYQLDFFILARGYGLGMCLMLIGMFNADLLWRKDDRKPEDYYPALIFAALAVWANFSFLNFYLAFIAVIELMIWQDNRNRQTIKNFLNLQVQKPVIIVSLALFGLIIRPLIKILMAHQLYGGMDGFWVDTATSLITLTTYERPLPEVIAILKIVVVLVIATAVLLAFIQLITGGTKKAGPLLSALMFLILPAWIFLAQHQLLHSEFPEGRTGVYFIPLFLFLVVRLIMALPRLFLLPAYGMAFCCLLNVVASTKMNYVLEWKYDMHTKDAMLLIKNGINETRTGSGNIDLGSNPLFEPSINFYRIYYKMDCIKELDRDGFVKGVNYKYVYTLNDDREHTSNTTPIHEFTETNTVLLVRN